LGAVSPELEEAHNAAVEIERAISCALRPGHTGKEIFNLSEETGRLLGYGDHLGGPAESKCGFVGHGVGLEIDEYPVIGPLDHQILPNMTIAVEPKMIYPGIGVVGIEDTYLTTADQPVRLTKLPSEIWRV